SKIKIESDELTFGLWRGCVNALDIKVCNAICTPEIEENSVCSKIKAARAFITLACILSGISAICLIVYSLMGDNKPRILLLAIQGLVFACLIMGIIGVAIGISTATNTGPLTRDLGAAAIVGIVAVVINVVGAIVALLIRQ
ncbi:unnamed protein product, partial [Rotaria sp. Silwood1]